MRQTGYIYAIENDLNDEVYIGSTLRSINERFVEHQTSARRRPTCTFHKFMALYGIEHFHITELTKIEVNSFFELQALEESYIRDYGTLNTINGTNKPQVHTRKETITKKRVYPKEPVKLPSKEDIIKIAFETSPYKCLDIKEFVNLFIAEEDRWDDTMFGSYEHGEKMHLSALLLQCLGYEGDFRVQQQHFKRFLKSNNIHPLELTSSDPSIKNYPTIQEEMKVMKPNVVASRKWLIVEPREFKKVIMKLNTKHGDKIREYYICLEELMRLYLEYCLYFRDRESKRQITSLEQKLEKMNLTMVEMKEEMNLSMEELKSQNEEHIDKLDTLVDQNEELKLDVSETNEKLDLVTHKLGVAVIDRSPRLEQKPLRERFVLFKRNVELAPFQYYAIRGQSIFNGRLSSYKERYPNLQIMIDIICQPNPRNLFLRFKNRARDDERFKFAGNNVNCSLEDETIMTKMFETLNEEKRNV
jgi:hypothetical protein